MNADDLEWTSGDTALARVWSDTVTSLGGTRPEADDAAHDLVRRYAQPHRRYHNATHVTAVLADAEWLATCQDLPPAELPVLRLAVCAHDVVYDAVPGEDERSSAQWAHERLNAAGVSAAVATRVASLVLTTIAHEAAPDDPTATALLDADLAILGTAPAHYDRYARAVREEYERVPEELWRAGRAAVLQRMMNAERLYRSPQAAERWERAARANLRRELDALNDATT